jgi:hypothetical protein
MKNGFLSEMRISAERELHQSSPLQTLNSAGAASLHLRRNGALERSSGVLKPRWSNLFRRKSCSCEQTRA